ncbi:sensor domain-containing diguanylate cyclase [Rudaea sp. 3F27F6]|uniref:sensor domain-containing diguanylate cyclase n=1 Tax=Rudaea sp. 3F27F6 TaxID=2502208 RepID=UPI0010F6D523|nr:sensor domain-containing diguanylate cyclase [Rudaea sp. 3F27F6]
MTRARRARKHPPAKASAAHIARALLSISALAIMIVGTGAFLLSYYFLHEQTARHLHTLISFAASESRSAIEFRDTKTASEILQSIPQAEGITFAQIRDASDIVLASIDARADSGIGRLADWIGNERVSQDVVVEGRRIGSVVLEGGSEPMLRTLTGLLVWFVFGMLLVAVCALALARSYTQRFTQPIWQLRNVIKQLIENRNFNQRAPASSLAEVEDLRREFNVLLDEIRMRDHLLTQSNAALRRVAYVDALTGLPNRAMFEPALQKTIDACKRSRTRAALFYLDIDAFKSINDNLGHTVGDELLSQIAARLRTWRPHETTATRIGGDEFVVLLSPLAEKADLQDILSQLHAQLETPIEHGKIVIHPSTSIGAAVYPDVARDTEELVRFADHAMYAAKSQRYREGLVTHWQTSPTIGEEPANSDWIDANPAAM